MIFQKKKSWYWQAFKALGFCWFLYRIAKRFSKAVSRQNQPKIKKDRKKELEPITFAEIVEKIVKQ